jgi:hypothetical protein
MSNGPCSASFQPDHKTHIKPTHGPTLAGGFFVPDFGEINEANEISPGGGKKS